jgi:hypothetical protein
LPSLPAWQVLTGRLGEIGFQIFFLMHIDVSRESFIVWLLDFNQMMPGREPAAINATAKPAFLVRDNCANLLLIDIDLRTDTITVGANTAVVIVTRIAMHLEEQHGQNDKDYAKPQCVGARYLRLKNYWLARGFRFQVDSFRRTALRVTGDSLFCIGQSVIASARRNLRELASLAKDEASI